MELRDIALNIRSAVNGDTIPFFYSFYNDGMYILVNAFQDSLYISAIQSSSDGNQWYSPSTIVNWRMSDDSIDIFEQFLLREELMRLIRINNYEDIAIVFPADMNNPLVLYRDYNHNVRIAPIIDGILYLPKSIIDRHSWLKTASPATLDEKYGNDIMSVRPLIE